MIKKIIRPTPDKLGYKDRGKMKWIGLILSDHTESLKQMEKKENNEPSKAKPQQSLAEIGQILAQAYQTKKPVNIQVNSVSNGQHCNDVACMVLGTNDNRIYLQLKNGRIVDTTIADIQHIEFFNVQIWYQKNNLEP